MTKAEIVKRGNKRKNSAFGADIAEYVGKLAGDMIVQDALQGCTMNEKCMVAIMIPEILKVIRAGGKWVIESKVLPEGEKEIKL